MEAPGRKPKIRFSDSSPGPTTMAVMKFSCCWYICARYARWRAERTYLPGGTEAKANKPCSSVISTRPESGGLGVFGEFAGFMATKARASGCLVMASITRPLIRNADGVVAEGDAAGGAATCWKKVKTKRNGNNRWTIIRGILLPSSIRGRS